MMTVLSTRELKEFFDHATISRGVSYANQHKVISAVISEQGPDFIKLDGKVEGSNKQRYSVEINIELHPVFVESVCSCPVGYNCKHAVAVIVSATTKIPTKQQQPKLLNLDEPVDYFLNHWVDEVSTLQKEQGGTELGETVVFILDINEYYREKNLQIMPATVRKLKNGSLSKPKFYYPSTEHRKVQLNKNLSHAFGLLDLYGDQLGFSKDPFIIKGPYFDQVIEELLATGQCYWQSITSDPLSLGKPLTTKFAWVMAEDGSQTLKPESELPEVILLPTSPLFYFNSSKRQLGEVIHNLPRLAGRSIFNFPTLPATQVKDFAKKAAERIADLPLPTVFSEVVIENHDPVPCLYLYVRELSLYVSKKNSRYGERVVKNCILAELKFEYAGIKFYSNNSQKYFTRIKNNTLLQIPRNFSAEQKHIQYLIDEADVAIVSDISNNAKNKKDEMKLANSFLVSLAVSRDKIFWLREVVEDKLKEQGWRVSYEENELFQNTVEYKEWYIDVEEHSGINWFGLQLGIMIGDEKLDLLPHLIAALQHSSLIYTDDHTALLSVPNKGLVPIPEKRLSQIMSVISEMLVYDAKSKSYQIQLEQKKAALLTEIEKAFAASELRKFGSNKLFEIGSQLANFKKIKKVTIPKKFSAVLRPYQQQGVNWLQFLRSYQFGGILADDMGLGKTIQTLGHLAIEKEQQRLTLPSIIVAPTSVIYNWANEIEKFAKHLSFVLWHGDKRLEKSDNLFKVDLILTTYPLIVRDAELLLKSEYYLLILDEAQTIKNVQAKMTQIVQQFKAQFRLCLTGTPLENHLEELWSQFNFLMPGLLGSKESFARKFRTPIEKHKNPDVQNKLSLLVKPFMLRRTKKEVIEELPDKTEIIQSVELGKEQRDLYETIRLTMNQKIQQAIDEKGLERSQIIILDALLKLRQVCCHPKLLSLKGVRHVNESAKLDALLELLTEMVEEGRKILLFSQFTSMLTLIEDELVSKQIRFVKLTGSTKDRMTPINKFQQGEVPLFLISLKAGGTGLNLTAADTVIHFDPWWNPAVETQATDRAHRIGQKQAVFVYKFICKNTVEEKIIELQQKKQALMEAIFSGGTHKGAITKADLDVLFSPSE